MVLRAWRDRRRLRATLADPRAFTRWRELERRGELHSFELTSGRHVFLRGGTRDFHIFHRIFVRDEYGLDGLTFDAGGAVIDVGAHSGLFALRVAGLGASVVAVEPDPGNLELLRRHVEENGLADRIRVVPQAIAAEPGRFRLLEADDPCAHRLGSLDDSRAGCEVEATTLTALVDGLSGACALLKLDCEGGEYAILSAAASAVLARVRRVRMEFHVEEGHPDDPAQLERLLREAGFTIERFAMKKHGRQGYLFAAR